MSIRHVVKTVAVSGAATVCAAMFALGMGSGVAGASTLTSSDGNTSLSTVGTVTSGAPYSSGQGITVAVGANSVMNNTALTAAGVTTGGNFYIEECTDPGGTSANLPILASNCETATLATAPHGSDGSMSLSGTNAFAVEDLPDPNLGPATMVGKCDVAPNECVLGIFSQNPNQAGSFALPHLFSAPFQMTVGDGLDVGNNPGDGTPEVPLAIVLPLAAVAVFGGWSLRNRRRRQQQGA